MKSFFILLLALCAINTYAQQEEANKIHSMAGLDKHPEFPGGNFQAEVVKHFTVPQVDEDISVRMYVSFTIEKDGVMTDVKCARDPGFGMCVAAEKAIKGITTKWMPGMEEGKPVRVSYTLPIVVNIKADTPPSKEGDGN